MGLEELVRATVADAVKEVLQEIKIPMGDSIPNVMTVKQVAKYLNVSMNWIYENIDRIPHYEMGGYKFNKEDVDKWRLDKTGRSFSVVPR